MKHLTFFLITLITLNLTKGQVILKRSCPKDIIPVQDFKLNDVSFLNFFKLF